MQSPFILLADKIPYAHVYTCMCFFPHGQLRKSLAQLFQMRPTVFSFPRLRPQTFNDTPKCVTVDVSFLLFYFHISHLPKYKISEDFVSKHKYHGGFCPKQTMSKDFCSNLQAFTYFTPTFELFLFFFLRELQRYPTYPRCVQPLLQWQAHCVGKIIYTPTSRYYEYVIVFLYLRRIGRV